MFKLYQRVTQRGVSCVRAAEPKAVASWGWGNCAAKSVNEGGTDNLSGEM